MTDKEINIAIAEACGWKRIESIGLNGDASTLFQMPNCHERLVGWENLPNYCDDLNAMHEAEKALTGETWADYFELLQHNGLATGTRATAMQRAKAFLEAISMRHD